MALTDHTRPDLPQPLPGAAPSSPGPAAATPWTRPTRSAAVWHRLKVWAHRALRTWQNLWTGPRRVGPASQWVDAPVVAEHRSALWLDGRAEEFVLRCGKVQNLRVAAARFQAVELRPGQVLSFWAQVGWPGRMRGFAVGREIINGCVVPTVGGGLCQLSNALAALATVVGARLVERHRHSALVEAQAPAAEDATVAWNHVDLRIAADFPWRIEVELTATELVLRARSPQAVPPAARRMPQVAVAAVPGVAAVPDERAVARGCLICDQTHCFRHQAQPPRQQGRMAVLLNDRHPELAAWLAQTGTTGDWMLPWVRPARRAQAWTAPPRVAVHRAWWPAWQRMWRQRLAGGEGARRQAGRTRNSEALAHHWASRLQPLHTELVLSQDLLVPLWRAGVLGGRRTVVHVNELPASVLQARLDAAAALHPGAPSLQDFRVDAAWQRDEWAALASARLLLTAHHEVVRVLQAAGLPVQCLPWVPLGGPCARAHRPALDPRPTLTLAASALPRKGALEVADVARALQARVLILGSAPDNTGPWRGVEWRAVGYASDWLEHSDVVVLPAFVEHQPRALLRALQAGVPVVASAACGLASGPGWAEVQPGDGTALLAAVRAALAAQPPA
ncbi:MAG: VanW family protein [Rubrivivax sp.]